MAGRRILVTGGAGQVGLELARLAWPGEISLHFPTRAELDLGSAADIAAYLANGPWDCVINCAAWTAVDAAEDQPGDACLVNAAAPGWLAEAARAAGAAMIQVSTDYVFSGELDRAYTEDDAVGPKSVYGAGKLAGEIAVRAAQPRSVVMRTAWVLSAHRGNFLKTMLRLGSERDKLSVVADQRGCPTAATDIAAALRTIALRLLDDEASPTGTYHFVNDGDASWHELAAAIFEMAADHGASAPEVAAIATDDYPTRASRPANSRLSTIKIARDFGIVPRPWRVAVQEIVGELLAQTPGNRRIT